ncbi:CD209 [Branchiostoma lanceolatum]|uniref:CD209 protein n=1 Tax=Branchiostoma lanceolatum TaxID=7740 RepID=A0A8K0EFB5_BRALA|nr:CD209 [Branchiostoma lanceolatum]
MSDGCPVGYKLLARSCFRLDFRTMSHSDARMACKREGARLAMPKTEQIDLALKEVVHTEGGNLEYWIAMRNRGALIRRKIQWLWEDGSMLGYRTMSTQGEEPRQVAHCRDTGAINNPVLSLGQDEDKGMGDIKGLASTDETNDVPNGHAHHRSKKGGNKTVRQIGIPIKNGGHETDRESRSTFPVTVSRNISGSVENTLYKTGSPQQAAHRELPAIPTEDEETEVKTVASEDCDDEAEAHEYNYINRDDVNNLRQSGEDNGQPYNKEDTALPGNAQRDAPDLLNNPTYVPGALRGDNNKEVWCKCLRSYLLRGIIIALAVAAMVTGGVVTCIYLIVTPEIKAGLQPPLHSKDLTTDSPVLTNGHNLKTASTLTTNLSEVTTIQQIVTGSLPAVTTTQPIVPATMPNVTTTQPKVTTTLPNVATAMPEVTSILPVVTTKHTELLVSTTSFMRQRKILKTAKTETTTTNGCQSGYLMHINVCFKAFNTPMNFPDASWTCRTDGRTLAMPKDASTNGFLISLKNGVDKQGCFWFGLVDQREEGAWEWIDGTPLGNHSVWSTGEPNNLNDVDCAQYDGEIWNDRICSGANGKFICQVKPPVKLVARNCFRLNFRKKSHSDAREACMKEGARLAMPKTKELDIALRNLVRTEGENRQYWIGMRDTGIWLHKRHWCWEDGSKLGNYKNKEKTSRSQRDGCCS